MVEPQLRGRLVDVPTAEDGAVGRGEVFRLVRAEVVLRGPQVVPVGLGRHPVGIDRDEVVAEALGAGLRQQVPQDHLGRVVVALAEVVVADPPLGVGEVDRGPVVVVERGPDRVVAVDRDRIVDAQLLDRPADVADIVFDVELGCVHADHHEPVALVLLGPGTDVGQRAKPVDAGVGPEVDQHHPAAQVRCRQRRRVEPPGRAVECGQLSFIRQVDRRRMPVEAKPAKCLPLTGLLVHESLLSGSPRRGPAPVNRGSGRLRAALSGAAGDEPAFTAGQPRPGPP